MRLLSEHIQDVTRLRMRRLIVVPTALVPGSGDLPGLAPLAGYRNRLVFGIPAAGPTAIQTTPTVVFVRGKVPISGQNSQQTGRWRAVLCNSGGKFLPRPPIHNVASSGMVIGAPDLQSSIGST